MTIGEPSIRVRPSNILPLLLALPVLLGGCSKKRSPVEPPASVEYALEVRWLGTPPGAVTQQAFQFAVARIKAIIVGGLTPVLLPADFNVIQCDSTLTGHPDIAQETVQGLVIYASIEAIDGQGAVLGSAGPCLVRDQNRFKPALGIMRLDEADLANFATQDRLDALILHEMMHVVGFGTVWSDNNLLSGDGTADARFTGPQARTSCANDLGGTTTCATSVPVHSTDGAGSAYSHWREATFGRELMTPFLNSGLVPLSAMSLKSLADLGYIVDATRAEPFTLSTPLLAPSTDGSPAVELPEPRRPRFTVSASGRLVPLGATR